jgi:tetratricopeptide (TPR) repeat protein
LALVGIGWHLRKKTRFAGILALLAAITGPAMLFPLVGLLTPIQVFEIGVWYLAFFLVCAPLVAGAAAALIGKIRPRAVRAAATVAVALLPVYPAAFFWAETGLAGFSFPGEHGRNRLRTLDYRAVLLFPYYGRQGLWGDAYYRFVEGRRRDVALADPRNAVPSEFAAIRSGPIFIRDPDAAEKWWFNFQSTLIASHSNRTFFFNVGTDSARNMGVTLEPYALLYRARRPGAAEGRPAPPWDRYEYAGLRAVALRYVAGAKTYDPTTYRIWALYFVTAAEYCFDRGRDDVALRNLAVAARAVDKDPRVGLFVASVYARNGYPEEAIPLYEMGLPAVQRYRTDAEMFRRDYTSYMAEITMAYLRAGDVEGARPYFDEAVALFPDRYGPEAGVTLEKLAAMVDERRVIDGE